MKKFFKHLGGMTMLYFGMKLTREADELDGEATFLSAEAQRKRSRASMAMQIAGQLLEGTMKTYVVNMDFDEDDLDEEPVH